jgi:hypothetical protein
LSAGWQQRKCASANPQSPSSTLCHTDTRLAARSLKKSQEPVENKRKNSGASRAIPLSELMK